MSYLQVEATSLGKLLPGKENHRNTSSHLKAKTWSRLQATSKIGRMLDFFKHKKTSELTTCQEYLSLHIELQEYKENVEQQNDDANLQVNRTLIKLTINSNPVSNIDLVFFRQRPALDNIDLLFSYASKNGKIHKQNSERFLAEELLERHFYFGISKRLIVN